MVPGFGVAKNIPVKEYPLGWFGSVKAGGKVIFGLGGTSKFAVNGSFEDKVSECTEDDCTIVAGSAAGSIEVGVIGQLEGDIKYCESKGQVDCNDVLIVKGKANTTFALPLSFESKRKIGGSSCSGSCIGYQAGGLDFVAAVGYEFIIGGIYRTQYSAEMSVNLADGLSQACNL